MKPRLVDPHPEPPDGPPDGYGCAHELSIEVRRGDRCADVCMYCGIVIAVGYVDQLDSGPPCEVGPIEGLPAPRRQEEGKPMRSEPFYLSTAFWLAALGLGVFFVQTGAALSAASSFAEGVAAVDWTTWVTGAASLVLGVVRAIKGASPDSPAPQWTLAPETRPMGIREAFKNGAPPPGAKSPPTTRAASIAALFAGASLALIFFGCSAGRVRPDASPWLEPVVAACPDACEVARRECLVAVDLVPHLDVRAGLAAVCEIAHGFGCVRACERAAAALPEPAP